ncbi:MAG: hypothetical protein JO235_01820 [Chroococcidiopsidaceae cyanobacterium CP_BM_RX_35]|nr:hypothetical protein [Chroococcidiopsidaceae cyanobacterium CP_BM_RX_35]
MPDFLELELTVAQVFSLLNAVAGATKERNVELVEGRRDKRDRIAMSFFQQLCWQLFKQRFLNVVVVGCLITVAIVVFQPNPTSAINIPTTPISFKQAPFSQVFFTGSVYAVKDKDYEPSEPSIGFFSLWSTNPTNNQLIVAARYCLPTYSLTATNARLSAITLLDKKQPLVTIDQSIAENPAQLREIQPSYNTPPHGFGDPFDDQFLNPLDENFDYAFGVHLPAVTCSAGGNKFDLTKLVDALAQLPNQTLEVKLVFSDGETQNWHLGKTTVKAIKDLLAIRQQLMTKKRGS